MSRGKPKSITKVSKIFRKASDNKTVFNLSVPFKTVKRFKMSVKVAIGIFSRIQILRIVKISNSKAVS